MKCQIRLASILSVSLFLFSFASVYPQSISSDQIVISRQELLQLKANLLSMVIQLQSYENQISVLKKGSLELWRQSQDLKKQIGALRIQYEALSTESTISKELQESLENSYKTLSVSFEAYKKEVNKELAKLKAKNTVLTVVSIGAGAGTALFATLYLIEKFGD